MYIVKFISKNDSRREDYYYKNYADALTHFCLFKEKDCDLYDLIILLDEDEIITTNKKGDDF